MGTKALLENKNSLSALISPVSPPTSASSVSDFSGFHLPPVTTRISPYNISGACGGSNGTPHYSNLNNNYHRKGRPLPGGIGGLSANGKKGSSSSSSKSKASACFCRCFVGLLLVLFWILIGIALAVFGIIIMRRNWDFDVVELGSQFLFKTSHQKIIIEDDNDHGMDGHVKW